jgi:predicted DNA-binding protein (UPF0251 family)
MRQARQDSDRSLEGGRLEVVARLRARRGEIEESYGACLRNAISHPGVSSDPDYLIRRRASIEGAVDLSLDSLESGEDSHPVPPSMSSQWERAARMGVTLEALMRAYTTAQSGMTDMIMEETSHEPREVSRELLRTSGLVVERLLAMMSDVYEREVTRMRDSREQRLLALTQKLLAGIRTDPAELSYKFGAWHLGVIATGVLTGRSLHSLAARLGRELLLVTPGDETLWAWLGGEKRISSAELERVVAVHQLPGASLAIGEPGWGLDGWRLTHKQAQAALGVALRTRRQLTRYTDCPLLAAALQDDTLMRSLRDIYLSPLAGERDGGALLRETLRAYFAVGCNAATAASLLGVERHTVARRLQKVEQYLGCPLHTCQAALDVAVSLEHCSAPLT